MSSKLTTNSQILEYIALGSCFTQCCIVVINDDMDMQSKLLLYFFVLVNLLFNNHFRGTRIHLYPLAMGYSLYSLTLLFGIFEEIAFYYYYLTTLISIALVFFFGTVDYY